MRSGKSQILACVNTFAADRSGMVRPLTRRVISWLIDLCVLALPTALVAMTQAEVFASSPPVEPGSAERVFTGAQQARIDTLAQLDSVSLTLGRSLYIWSDQGLWLTVATVVLLALLLLCLLPANLSGATLGMRLTGFRVVTTDGSRARLRHHLIRTIVGTIDVVPFVIPGLLGFLFAFAPGHRRLGDRAAGTVVTEVRHLARRAATESKRRNGSAPSTKPVAAQDPPLQAELPVTAPKTSQSAPEFWSKQASTPTIEKVKAEAEVKAEADVKVLVPAFPVDLTTFPPPATTATPNPAEVQVPVAETNVREPSLIGPAIADFSTTPTATLPDLAPAPAPEPLAAVAPPLVPTAEPIPTAKPVASAEPEPEPEPEATPARPTVPEWSDDQEAWVVTDQETGRLFRHDPDLDRWLAVNR